MIREANDLFATVVVVTVVFPVVMHIFLVRKKIQLFVELTLDKTQVSQTRKGEHAALASPGSRVLSSGYGVAHIDPAMGPPRNVVSILRRAPLCDPAQSHMHRSQGGHIWG